MKRYKFLYFVPIFTLAFCDTGNTVTIDTLTPPIILITKSDTLVEAEGAEGKRCILYTNDRVNYRISFYKEGDTLNINK